MKTTARERNLIRRVRRLHRLRREIDRLQDGPDRKALLAAVDGAEEAVAKIDEYVMGLGATSILRGGFDVLRRVK